MIEQDSRGIVYFANNKGLLEFDGTYWLTYPLPNGTIARSVAFDHIDKIYAGAQDEFGYFSPDENGRQIYYSLIHLVPEAYRGFEDIWHIFILEDLIYFCSAEAIFKFNGEEILVIPPKSSRFGKFFELEGKIFVQEIEGALYELKGQEFELIIPQDIFPYERVIAIFPYGPDQKLIITFSNGLFLLDNSGVNPWEVPSSSFLKKSQAYCAIELKNGKYAIGTPQDGVLIMDASGIPEMHINEKEGLQNNTVLCIAQDRQENIWLGLDNGISYVEINSPFSNIQYEQGITGTGYSSTIYNGKLYLGTNQGLYYMNWDDEKLPLDEKRFQVVKNSLGQVWSINGLGEDIVVGQHKGASFLEEDKLNNFSNIRGAWKFLELSNHPGYALEGTYAGLYLYKKNLNANSDKKGPWELVGKIGGFDESARIFEEDKQGNIWVSHTYKGLYRLSLSPDLQEVEEIELFGIEHGIIDGHKVNVAKIRNELVFASPYGVLKYDGPNNVFVSHPDFLEIFGEHRNFHRLMEDEIGNIWFSVDKEFGVIKVEEQGVFNKFEINYFNQLQDELVDGFEHVFAHDKNNVFIGTEKGFVHYAPLKNKDTNFPFNILIRKVTSITDQDSVVYGGNAIRATTEAYEFHSNMDDWRFEYSIPYYEKIGYLAYRFKLEGFTEKWTDWSSKTEKEYTNLRPGDYTFIVQAKNAYGEISKEASFSFTILPSWYWSWYAKLAYFLLSIIAIFGLVKYVAKREAKKTAAFKKEQTQKLELKEAEFKREVEKSESEIIKLRNEKLNDDVKHKTGQLASAAMHLVQKSEILMKIRNDLKGIASDANPDIKKKITKITRTIESDIQLDENWEQFENYFDQVHENFFKRLRLKYPELTPKDQKLCAYLRMNLTTKEIAPLMNISVRGVEISRYRLRKKLNLNSEVNLVTFILEL